MNGALAASSGDTARPAWTPDLCLLRQGAKLASRVSLYRSIIAGMWLFEGTIKGLMENRKTQAAAFLWVYDDARCLLSDRGYCQPIEEAAHMSMSFNLCSNAFIDYAFFDMAVLLRDRASPEFLCEALEARAQLPQATINVTLTRNDLSNLARYNRRVINFPMKESIAQRKTDLF